MELDARQPLPQQIELPAGKGKSRMFVHRGKNTGVNEYVERAEPQDER